MQRQKKRTAKVALLWKRSFFFTSSLTQKKKKKAVKWFKLAAGCRDQRTVLQPGNKQSFDLLLTLPIIKGNVVGDVRIKPLLGINAGPCNIPTFFS